MSTDTGSARKGGDLGWSLSVHFVKEFADAMRALAPAGLVRSGALAVRLARRLTYEELRDLIEQRLRAVAQKAR